MAYFRLFTFLEIFCDERPEVYIRMPEIKILALMCLKACSHLGLKFPFLYTSVAELISLGIS